MEDQQSSVKVFWTEGKVCNWGLEGSLHCMSRRIIAGGSASSGDRGSFQNTSHFSFSLISNTTGLHLLIA